MFVISFYRIQSFIPRSWWYPKRYTHQSVHIKEGGGGKEEKKKKKKKEQSPGRDRIPSIYPDTGGRTDGKQKTRQERRVARLKIQAA